jgi:hypothetical protein
MWPSAWCRTACGAAGQLGLLADVRARLLVGVPGVRLQRGRLNSSRRRGLGAPAGCCSLRCAPRLASKVFL